MSAFVSVVGLVGQVSTAAADTFTWDVQIDARFDWLAGGSGVSYTAIPPIAVAWNLEFEPVVQDTDVQDYQPDFLSKVTTFSAAGIATDATPLTAGIWAGLPAGATFTHTTEATADQAFSAAVGSGFRRFQLSDRWLSNDIDADPNVETTVEYVRQFGGSTQSLTGFGEVEMFDAFSIVEFMTVNSDPTYYLGFLEMFRIQTRNLTTGETTWAGSWWTGPATLTSHVPTSPGSPTPVPEPATMALVAAGLVVTAVRNRGRLC